MPIKKEKSLIIDAVKKVCPAVVSITMTAHLPRIKEYPFFPFGPQGPGWVVPREEGMEDVKVSGGSGFFVFNDGLILTNRHVVSEVNADYSVVTNDRKEYPVKVLARDPINDIAILKINVKNTPCLELGDSENLELGQTVIAVGNVLGQFNNTVSTGVVSGLSRYITASSGLTGQAQQLRGLIQTDAAVNPGNSGGPLVNIFAQVIGINTAVVLGAQNIGFTIPVNSAKKDLEDYKKYGRIKQPFLGVRHIIINEILQKQLNLPVGHGALILTEPDPSGGKGIAPNSPAARANLSEKDIILAINGKEITEENTLQDIVQKCQVGEEIKLTILKGQNKAEIKVKLTERE